MEVQKVKDERGDEKIVDVSRSGLGMQREDTKAERKV